MWRLVVILVVIVTLGGCGPMTETEPGARAKGDYGYGTPKELGALMERRDAEEVLADRDRMLNEITTKLSLTVPGSQWVPHREQRRSGCGEFGSTYGERVFGQIFTSETAVPAALWNQASQAVVDIAARYGYTNVTGRTENPVGDESTDLTITDSDGGRLSFGSQANAVLQVVTGCYLTAENKRKAREAAPK